MKAKEYATDFLTNTDITDPNSLEKALQTLVITFSQEAIDLAKARMPNPSISCLIGVLKEQSNKWAAFSRIVNEILDQELIRSTGFKDFSISTMPQLKGKL